MSKGEEEEKTAGRVINFQDFFVQQRPLGVCWVPFDLSSYKGCVSQVLSAAMADA